MIGLALIISFINFFGVTNEVKFATASSMEWPFDLPKKKLVLSSRHVEEGAPVYYVSHDVGDGVWQFHPHQKFGTEDADVRLVTLKSIYLLDETLGQLGDLPEGWHAWREAPEAPWQREEMK